MHTNIDIDKELLEKAVRAGHFKTKKAAVHEALAHYVRTTGQQRILELAGTIDYDPDYDYKAERQRR